MDEDDDDVTDALCCDVRSSRRTRSLAFDARRRSHNGVSLAVCGVDDGVAVHDRVRERNRL